MAAPSLSDSPEMLIEALRATEGSGSRQFDIAKEILAYKHQIALLEHQKIVMRFSHQLTIATWVLAVATIALAVATIGSLWG